MKRFLRNKNKKGFTLVELIIAVAILAIIVAPLVSNFVQSNKINQKSRKNLNAMNMAQDIMEGIASKQSAEKFIIGMEEADAMNTLLVGASYKSYGAKEGGAKVEKGASGDTLSGTAKYHNAAGIIPSSEYEFTIKEVKEPQGKNKYNVDIKLQPTVDHADFGKKIAQVANNDLDYDSTYTSLGSTYTDAIAYFKQKKPSLQTNDFLGKVKREIVVDVTYDESTSNYEVKVKEKFKVKRKTDEYAEGVDIPEEASTYETSEDSVFNSQNCPRNIYIYYTATPASTVGNKLDTVTVNNNIYVDAAASTSGKVLVYLMRQDTVANNVSVENYSTDISVNSNGSNDETKLIYNNIKSDNCKFNYNSVEVARDHLADSKKFYEGIYYEKQELLYDVIVTIADVKNPDKPVAKYEGKLGR